MKKDKEYKTEIKEFGELVPGDRIVGSDGQPVTVTDVYEKHIPDRMYEIEMEDGEVVQASGNHLWYCESDHDVENKEYYKEIAIEYFENNVIPEKEKHDRFPELKELITVFGDDIRVQIFIQKAAKSLGHSRVGDHLILEDDQAFQENLECYSYNDLIDFLHDMKKAVIDNEGYFYFGEVRDTDKIASLMNAGVSVNIPHKSDVK